MGLVRAVNVWEVFCILNFRTTAIRGHTAVATAAFFAKTLLARVLGDDKLTVLMVLTVLCCSADGDVLVQS